VPNVEPNTSKPLGWVSCGPVSARGKRLPNLRRKEPRLGTGSETYQGLLLPLLLILVVCLLGCSTPSTVISVKPEVPVSLTQPCPDLPDIPDRSERSVAEWIVQTISLYYQCQSKHQGVVDAVGTH
jgi:hypothetical protein